MTNYIWLAFLDLITSICYNERWKCNRKVCKPSIVPRLYQFNKRQKEIRQNRVHQHFELITSAVSEILRVHSSLKVPHNQIFQSFENKIVFVLHYDIIQSMHVRLLTNWGIAFVLKKWSNENPSVKGRNESIFFHFQASTSWNSLMHHFKVIFYYFIRS